jgi:hypothetical protein
MVIAKTDVSEELSASIIRMTRIGEVRKTLAQLATDARCEEIQSLVALMIEALSSFETSILTRATRRNIPVDDILHR